MKKYNFTAMFDIGDCSFEACGMANVNRDYDCNSCDVDVVSVEDLFCHGGCVTGVMDTMGKLVELEGADIESVRGKNGVIIIGSKAYTFYSLCELAEGNVEIDYEVE